MHEMQEPQSGAVQPAHVLQRARRFLRGFGASSGRDAPEGPGALAGSDGAGSATTTTAPPAAAPVPVKPAAVTPTRWAGARAGNENADGDQDGSGAQPGGRVMTTVGIGALAAAAGGADGPAN